MHAKAILIKLTLLILTILTVISALRVAEGRLSNHMADCHVGFAAMPCLSMEASVAGTGLKRGQADHRVEDSKE